MKQLASLLHFIPVAKGEFIFHDGDIEPDGNPMYIVYQGELRAVAAGKKLFERVERRR